jgi:hypothetical protein
MAVSCAGRVQPFRVTATFVIVQNVQFRRSGWKRKLTVKTGKQDASILIDSFLHTIIIRRLKLQTRQSGVDKVSGVVDPSCPCQAGEAQQQKRTKPMQPPFTMFKMLRWRRGTFLLQNSCKRRTSLQRFRGVSGGFGRFGPRGRAKHGRGNTHTLHGKRSRYGK